MAELYLLNPEDQVLGVLTEETGLISTLFREELNRLPDSPFRFTVEANVDQAQYVKEENQVAFRDKEGDLRLFVIKEVDDVDNRNGPETTVICEPAFMELKETIIVGKHVENEPAEEALDAVLEGTRWTGEVEVQLGNATTTFHYMSSIDAIWEILVMWGGEVKDVVEFDERNHITARKILLKQRLGRDHGGRFEIDYNTEEIQRTVLSYPITALYGRGASLQAEDGVTQYLDFAEVEWSVVNGDPVDKPLGQRWVGDPEALPVYGRRHEGKLMHREGIWENQNIEEPEELLQATWEKLPEVQEPAVNYKLSVALLDKHTSLGDTARAIDRQFARPIEIQTRVIAIEYDVLDPTNTAMVEMGQFLHAHDPDDRIDRVMEEIDRNRSKWESDSKPITNDRFPNITPSAPIDLHAKGSYQTIQVFWEFNLEVYVNQYELYASQVQGFVPDSQHMIYRGPLNGYNHLVETDEVWYYRVRALNTHNTPSDFSDEVSASSIRVLTEDIVFGEETAERLRDLQRLYGIIGDGDLSFEQISQQARDLLGLEAKQYTDQEVTGAQHDLMNELAEKAGLDYVDGQLQFKADQTTVDNQMSDVMQELGEKAGLDYVDGQLISKANVGDVYTIEDIDNKFDNVVSVTQYTVDMDGVVTDLNSQESRISQSESDIGLKVNETKYEEGLADAKRYGSELIINPNETTLFHFDNHLRSSSGIEPTNKVATLRPGEGKFGGAVAVEEGTENLFYQNMVSDFSALEIGDSYSGSGRRVTRLGENQYKIEWLEDRVGTQSVTIGNNMFTTRPTTTWSVVVDEFHYAEGSNANLGFGYNSSGSSSLRVDSGLGYKRITLGTGGNTTHRVALRTNSTDAIITAGTYVVFSNMQVEEKPFATSFVDGVRSESGILEYSTPATRSEQFTLSGYFKFNLENNSYMTSIFGCGDTANDFYLRAYGGQHSDTRRLRFRLGNTLSILITSQNYISDNIWYLIALTWNRGEIKVFVNGEEIFSRTVSQNTIEVAGDNLVIGTRKDYPSRTDSVMNGLIDELRIDNVARTPEEIKRWHDIQKPFVDSESTDTYRQVTETQASVNVLAGRVELMASREDLLVIENELSSVTTEVGSLTVAYDGIVGKVESTELLVDDLTGDVSSALSQIGELELRADSFNVSIGELSTGLNNRLEKVSINVSNTTDALILLCRSDVSGTNNYIIGEFFGKRGGSGNNSAGKISAVLTNANTNDRISGFIESSEIQDDDSWSLVLLDYNGSEYVALRKSQQHRQWDGFMYFTGEANSSGELFLYVDNSSSPSSISNIRNFSSSRNVSTPITRAQTQIDQNTNQIALRASEISILDDKMTQAESEISVMSDEINLKVDRDGLVSAINLQPEGVRIKGSLIHLDGLVQIDNGVIENAHIANLSAAKITTGTMLGDRIQANTLNGNRIIAGTLAADRITTGMLSGIDITGVTITGSEIYQSSGSRELQLRQGRLDSYYQGELAMSFGQFSLEFFNRVNEPIGKLQPLFNVGNPNIRGLGMEIDQDFFTIGIRAEGLVRPTYRASVADRETIVAGPYVRNTGDDSSTLALYANTYLRGTGSPTNSIDQPSIIMTQGRADNNMYQYFGGYNNRNNSVWEVRHRTSTSTSSLRIRAEQSGVHLSGRVTGGSSGTSNILGSNGNFYYENNTGSASLNRISSLMAGGLQTLSGNTNLYLGTRSGGQVRITDAYGANGDNLGSGGISYRDLRCRNLIESSSRTYKENIELFDGSALEAINDLAIVTYDFIDDIESGVDDRKTGIISEDSPLFATEDGLAIQTGKLLMYSVKSIQELSGKVNDHADELNWLKIENQYLHAKIKDMEERIS